MMLVQQYLNQQKEEHGDALSALQELNKEFFIDFKVYDKPEHRIVLLDYNQIYSPKKNPIVRECRSLILDLDTFEVISRSFDRFFNYGEDPDGQKVFSYKDAFTFEKADGSLIKCYNLRGQWFISTRGMAFAEGPSHFDPNVTFCDMVLKAFGFKDMDEYQKAMAMLCVYYPNRFKENTTYIFEYTDPLNRIVTPYDRACMVLLCARNNQSFVESTVGEMSMLVSSFMSFRINVRDIVLKGKGLTEEKILELTNGLVDLQEGHVVYDPVSGQRIKFKNLVYLTAHSIKGNNGITLKKALLLIFKGDASEFATWFPEYKEFIDKVENNFNEFMADVISVYNKNKHIQDRKAFALAVKDHKGSGIIFEAHKIIQDLKKKDPGSAENVSSHIFEAFSKMTEQAKLRLFMTKKDLDSNQD